MLGYFIVVPVLLISFLGLPGLLLVAFGVLWLFGTALCGNNAAAGFFVAVVLAILIFALLVMCGGGKNTKK